MALFPFVAGFTGHLKAEGKKNLHPQTKLEYLIQTRGLVWADFPFFPFFFLPFLL